MGFVGSQEVMYWLLSHHCGYIRWWATPEGRKVDFGVSWREGAWMRRAGNAMVDRKESKEGCWCSSGFLLLLLNR